MRCSLLLRLGGVLLLGTVYCTRPRLPQHVDTMPLVTMDVDHFWAAYAAALRDTAHADRIFQE